MSRKLNVRLIPPQFAHKEQLRVLRNTYRANALLDAKEAAMEAQVLADKRRAQETKMREDILAFKRDQRRSFSDIGDGGSDVDPIKEALGINLAAPKTPKRTDNAIYIAERAKIRAETEANRQMQVSKHRENALLYLLYASDSFVTRSNLDKRIDECLAHEFSPTPTASAPRAGFAGKEVGYATLHRLAREKLAGTDNPFSNDQTGSIDVEKFMGAGQIQTDKDALPHHTHATVYEARMSSVRGTRPEIGALRRVILSDAAKGTVAGRDGIEAIAAGIKSSE
ncbi:hypothetical protein BJ741DRAFT_709407 [Chytriomyces cf. hyalinus JEL632]|nr:hypothetical protein BJ741DRAFT_709407 [Chytriomyces cf. hyalinus JEL632]